MLIEASKADPGGGVLFGTVVSVPTL